MTPMVSPLPVNMSSDRKRKTPIMVRSSRKGNIELSRSVKLSKLLAVEELAVSRRRRRRSDIPQALDQAAMKLWRQRVVQWFFDIVDHFELPRDVVYVASDILDRYTTDYTINSTISSSHYQEAAIASIFLASRMLKPSRMSMESLLQTIGKTSGNMMTNPQAMEVVRGVVSALDWTYPILVPSVFVKQLFGMTAPFFPVGQRMRLPLEHVLYLTELAVLGDLSSSRSFASDIALAALIQTMNPKTGPANCCLTQGRFELMTEMLRLELNLDCSQSEIIQSLGQAMEGVHAQSLDSFSSRQEPSSAPPKPTPVLIKEDSEQETICEETSIED